MQHDPLIGQQLGTYLIQSKLGEGGMARVYKAYHARLRREVAIKVISSQTSNLADFQARFERESQLVASLEHRNIVAVYDFGEIGNLTYLVMQYVGGGTLRDQLLNGQAIEPRRATHYARQMAQALHHAHLRGIVHRDVKPQNMLVSASDPTQLLLSDFGIAKIFDSSQETTITPGSMPADPSLTSADQIIGTAEYMAPEQVNRQAVDARTDVYALGVVLYHMLTGHVPFHSTTVIGLLYQHVNTPPKPIREINPNVPEVLAQITARALEKSPEARFQSAEMMAQALETAMAPSTHQYPTPVLDTSVDYRRHSDEISTILNQTASHVTGQVSFPEGKLRTNTTDSVGSRNLVPSRPRTMNPYRIQIITAIILTILAIVLIVPKVFPSIGLPSAPGTIQTSSIKPFLDNFHENNLQWPVGNINGLQATLGNNQYNLTTDSNTNTHFPYPASGGTLPANFTLMAQISQETGGTDVAYGITFNFTSDGGNQVKSCYAFVIYSNGNYAVLRYDNGQWYQQWSHQWHGSSSLIHSGLHRINRLQVVARENTFSFMINNSEVQYNGSTTILDRAYTGGLPGLLVTGPSANFIVTKVQLTIP